MQRRGHGENIGSPGLIGCFGGKVDAAESPEDAAGREVREETSLDITGMNLTEVASFNIRDSLRGTTYDIKVDAYSVAIPAGMEVRAREGSLVRLAHTKAAQFVGEMTPATSKLFKIMYKEK